MHDRSRNIAAMEGTATQTVALGDTTARFNLVEYAHAHRYRLRNLNGGGPCPPAIWKRPKDWPRCPKQDELWAIVGYDGYLSDDGYADALGIALFYKSAKGVNRAKGRIRATGGNVLQEGDAELAGTVPLTALEEALKLIRVSRLKVGDEHNLKRGEEGPAQNAYAG